MKYKFWWMVLVGISAYFGIGLLMLAATGTTYLYHPIIAEGDIEARQKLGTLVFNQSMIAVIFGAWAGIWAVDDDHLK